ncbi:MAG: hydroxyacid dehydrogenase [Chlamydiales bacterium 38-26]|nr:NAD(P)-dependent alcohol dehydrogenase [Chlamydiales bacterium]OJV11195.1 MAG: hydroxyacid dehydrogenase [Chlamydiales bacterium 38-26]
MEQVIGYANQNEKAPLEPFKFERRELGPSDVKIDILYCGVCHSDLHTARNEWKSTVYPCVPGHEIVGKVAQIGKDVKNFKVGERVAVGCMVDSCRTCPSCKDHLEQYCEKELVLTYNSPDKHTGKMTYGGYSSFIVVDENYVLHIPKEFRDEELPHVAPLLCAGITTYSPLKHWGIKKGSVVGIVGLGGLGHMGIKIAHALGAHVVLFTTSAGKTEDAKRLGADEVVISTDQEAMAKQANRLDFILDTVSVKHNLDPFVQALKREGVLCLLGAPEEPHPSPSIINLIFRRRGIVGSIIGGIKETQEMLDFCAKHHITSDIELIPIQKINEAYERVLKSDVKYRFVIDMASLSNL